MDKDFEAHSQRVRDDHYVHWAALLGIAYWGGWVFGWSLGVGIGIGLLVAISVTNMIVLICGGGFGWVKVSRWGWLVLALVGIVYMSADVPS